MLDLDVVLDLSIPEEPVVVEPSPTPEPVQHSFVSVLVFEPSLPPYSSHLSPAVERPYLERS